MKIELDLEKLVSLGLSPTEYVTLYLLYIGCTDYPISPLDSLVRKKWIDKEGNVEMTRVRPLFTKESVDSWVSDWLALWPSKILPGGYRVSGNTVECKKRMKRFMRSHPEFDSDTILKATKAYLKRQEAQGWAFTKKNAKFIFDSETSTLEQECLALTDNTSDNSPSNTIDL